MVSREKTKITLHSLCQDPSFPGVAKPTYAAAAVILSLLIYLMVVNIQISEETHEFFGAEHRFVVHGVEVRKISTFLGLLIYR